VQEIGDMIRRLSESGITILLVEQKLPIARRVADQFCILDKGQMVAEGLIAELSDEIVRRHLTV
jgi:urea transport system ATP-binding protein